MLKANGLYQAIRYKIVAKKTTKLVFFWPNMSQKSMNVLSILHPQTIQLSAIIDFYLPDFYHYRKNINV